MITLYIYIYIYTCGATYLLRGQLAPVAGKVHVESFVWGSKPLLGRKNQGIF